MTPSIWQLLIVLVIVLLLFGRGKIPQLMGDMARGIKSFKKGVIINETSLLSGLKTGFFSQYPTYGWTLKLLGGI